MSSNNHMITDASLCNSINLKGFSIANKGFAFSRNSILNNYSQEVIDACWESLSINIIQNYQRGKGTSINNFGTFSFKGPEVNLEGTTNEYIRDKKPREPVFLVSKDFNHEFKIGEYTKQNGIRYYNQKDNKNIPIVKYNLAEIAFSLSLSKDEVANILDHYIKYLGELIKNNNFKGKIMPGLGVLLCRKNIIAVKFNEEFAIENKLKNKKLNFIKNNLSLDMNMDKAQDAVINQYENQYKIYEELKSTNSLYTTCEKSAKDYMNKKYNITFDTFIKNKNNNNMNTLQHNIFNKNKYQIKFDDFVINKKKSKNVKNNKTEINNNSSILNIIDEETLNNIGYYKGIMIKECKNLDETNNGLISKEDAINALLKSKISEKIDYNVAKEIVEFYNKTENVEYMKLIAQLTKDYNLLSDKKNENSDINYHTFRRENFFNSNSFNKFNNIKDSIQKNRFTSFKITNNPNKLRTNSTDIKKNNNLKLITSYSVKNSRNNNKAFKDKTYTNINSKEKTKTNYLEKNEKLNIDTNNIDNTNKTNNTNNVIEEKKEINKQKNNNDSDKTKEDALLKKEIETEDKKSKLLRIISLIPDIQRKYFIYLDQNICCEELMRILSEHELYYPKDIIISLLNFIGIQNYNSFSLKEFIYFVKTCKVLQTSISMSEFNKVFKKLKDVIYINGGSKFLFNNNINTKSTIDCDTFVKLFKDKLSFTEETLVYAFRYLVKTDRDFNVNDYINYFDNPNDKITFDEPYLLKMMKIIIGLINNLSLKVEEYFDHLISNNTSTEEKTLTKLNWIKYIQNDHLPFSAEELDHLFNWIDTKKDNILDLEEFVNCYNYCLKPLTILKDIIHNNKLDIEDLAHRMKINMNELEKYDYYTFAQKIKKLDYTLPDEFTRKLFAELCEKKEKTLNNNNNNKNIQNTNNNTKNNNNIKNNIDSKFFLDEINYVKPVENYKSFTQNYLEVIRSKISYEKLKQTFEKFDDESIGTLTKLQYVSAVSDILPEFTDEDHMRFIRISNLFDKEGKILYPELLNLVYYFNKTKLSDPFTKLCQTLIEILEQKCNNDIEVLMYLIDTGIPKKKFSLITHKPLTSYQIKKFLNELNLNVDIPIKIIQKLDIDADGLISLEDLKGVLKRYSGTLYFKYSNDSTSPNIKLFSKETMNDRKIKTICVKIQSYMKSKNISPNILFKKFDKDNDGLISNIDFNQGIEEIFHMSPALGDPFFNYLDFYHIGMVDLETFIARINKFVTTHIVVHNNNKIEREIIEKMKQFIVDNKNLSDNEIFQVMDKDCDGLISLNDFEYFVKNNLNISELFIDKSKLERVMMSLSLSKNLQIGLNDIREFIDKSLKKDNIMNLKEIFKLTTNQNLSDLKKNVEWTNDIIERFGMFISEKYDNIEQFFKENSEPGTNKFKFEDFLKFHEKNYELFNNGFNLTKDELLSIYTSLDSQKKNFLTLQDIKNKLQVFNFYTKMHIDVKKFIKDNFKNSIDAFKFFIGKKIHLEKNQPNYMSEEEALKCHITLKEFFDAFKIFFPNKYANNTILKYLNKYFNITLPGRNGKNDLSNKKDTISFSEFNYIYFDKVENDETFINKRGNDTKLMTNRVDIEKKFQNKLSKKNSQDNFYYSNLFKKRFETLETPFDNDALLKLKRILCSSKYDLNSFFETISLKCPNDNFIINKYQFKHIIKELNLGLTNIEIDQIYQKIEKVSYDGNINLKNFVKILFNQNPILQQGKNNISKLIEEIKSLIYKFYSNPIICFQNNDTNHMGKIDFEQFKNIIYDMYHRNEQSFPNFTQIKNAFDACDLRKDGIIDINEWCKAFASYNGKLDPSPENVSNGLEFFDNKFKTLNNFKLKNNIEHNRKVLRDWETSGDISQIYKFINKNRKYIRKKILDDNLFIKSKKGDCIHPDNLLKVLQDLMPTMLMSKTQWKMIVNIGKSKKFESLIDINEFFRLIEITAMNLNSHPNINIHNKNKVNKFSNSVRNYKFYMNTDMNYNNKDNLFVSCNGFTPKEIKKNSRYISFSKKKENELVKSEN